MLFSGPPTVAGQQFQRLVPVRKLLPLARPVLEQLRTAHHVGRQRLFRQTHQHQRPVLIPDYVWKIAVVVPSGFGMAANRITATNDWPFYVTSPIKFRWTPA